MYYEWTSPHVLFMELSQNLKQLTLWLFGDGEKYYLVEHNTFG